MGKSTETSPQVVVLPMVHRLGMNIQELEAVVGLVKDVTDRVTDRAFSEDAGEQGMVDAIWWRGFNRRMQDRLALARQRESR